MARQTETSGRVQGLPERIKSRREAIGLSQPELAERMGGKSSRAEVSQYENGWKQPSAAKLVALSKALRCSTDWLLGLARAP